MDLSLEQIQEMLRDYVPSDVYTVDETGLFFRASPNNAPSHVLGCVALSNLYRQHEDPKENDEEFRVPNAAP
ncbi:hypothetical protein PC113_g25610, partial [Phytophthora cactorum]